MSHYRLTVALAVLGGALVFTIVAYVIYVVVDATPAAAFLNVSHAMEPTLLPGDRFTIRELRSAPTTAIRRGELVAHAWPPDRSKRFIKRVVGLPGDTIAMAGGRLQVNNRPVAERYAWLQDTTIDPVSEDFRWQRAYVVRSIARDTAKYLPSRDNWGPLVIPDGMYFVLGDNRDNSLDSRYWGFLPHRDILGEVRRVYFSRDSTGRIRWNRLGRRVQ